MVYATNILPVLEDKIDTIIQEPIFMCACRTVIVQLCFNSFSTITAKQSAKKDISHILSIVLA
jgi:hypothetical protein